MARQDEHTDTYIAKAADFAKPILIHIRKLMHDVCPDVEEAKKWGFIGFLYKGEILCTLAAFKNYCAFGFWKQSLLKDEDNIFQKAEASAGSIGHIKSLKDLPKDAILKKYIKAAMKLNEEGIKVPKPKPSVKEKKELEVPAYFIKELKKNKAAEKVFNDFSYSYKKEYIQWFEEAKTEATRDKRTAQALEWIAIGKGRNWKYEKP